MGGAMNTMVILVVICSIHSSESYAPPVSPNSRDLVYGRVFEIPVHTVSKSVINPVARVPAPNTYSIVNPAPRARCISIECPECQTFNPRTCHCDQIFRCKPSPPPINPVQNVDKLEVSWVEGWRCGPSHRLPDGRPGQCNPQGEHPCCNPVSGWCGNTPEHCACHDCIDHSNSIGVTEAIPRCSNFWCLIW